MSTGWYIGPAVLVVASLAYAIYCVKRVVSALRDGWAEAEARAAKWKHLYEFERDRDRSRV